jgi:hypothetical protein
MTVTGGSSYEKRRQEPKALIFFVEPHGQLGRFARFHFLGGRGYFDQANGKF